MHRKAILSLFIAMALMALLAVAVSAQEAPEAAAESPETSVEPFAALITQTVPLTLTINISGPDGIQAIAVPVLLNLDIRLAFTNVLTTTVAATAEVVIPTEGAVEEEPAAPTPVATATQAPTPTPAPEEPTAPPAPPTPRPLAPTATSAPAEDAEATATPAAEEEPAATEQPVEEEVVAPPAACPDPRAMIFSPGANEVISGTVQVFGTAQHEAFKYYKLEYALGADADPSGEFAFLMDVTQPVIEGSLATLDTTVLDNGVYTLRLTVVDQTGNFPPPCTVTVEIAN